MIGRIAGTLVEKQPPRIMIDVGGIGYELEVPMSTIYALPEINQPIRLHVHQGVRDEVPVLYGFAEASERSMFRALIKVNGVGPRLALTILSGISADALRQCIEQRDITTLTRLPGIGKRTAERLTLELADLGKQIGATTASGSADSAPMTTAASPMAEAEAALVALGYRPAEAQKLLSGLSGEHSEELIRSALQKAVRQ
ncbi:Holliday junction branch migration protein RuvA [Spiribacter sp. C176]|uniref:Holliday junction branch migration complex subunit RuvA n=1 Tax=Spiribacter salilacus TaxID=2664894 RepID=A0A6N7QZ19_9GAMM|nr:Holliday junction branch migration protein RuvA [Spiribacter salilacus]MRH77904.1 Holliday junction branch migration protein RuvA [Spiribacter salilacus]